MHSYVSCLVHCVFVTKDRRRVIPPDLQARLWPYLGGIARENKIRALEIGGVEDHVHCLLSLPSTLSVAKAVQLLKGNSSRWVHDTFPEHWTFAWQEGYGAFSIGVSGVASTVRYIQDQPNHHRKLTFREEMERFLTQHGMQFVPDDLDESTPDEGSRSVFLPP
jgi:REP element-mobilizing transposase RayT